MKNTMNALNRAARGTLIAGICAVALTGCAGNGLFKSAKKTTPTVGERVSILSKIETGTEVDPTLAGVSVVLPPPISNTEWSQVGGSASKSYGHLALAENPTTGLDRDRSQAPPIA